MLFQHRRSEIKINEEIARRSGETRLDIAKALLALNDNNMLEPGPLASNCFVRLLSGVECLYIEPDHLTYLFNTVFEHQHTKEFYLQQLDRMNALVKEPKRGRVKRFRDNDYAVIRFDIVENYARSIQSLVDEYSA